MDTHDGEIDHLIYLVQCRLIDWETRGLISFDGSSFAKMRRLFGVSSVFRIPVSSLQALAGEHGWAYYKMLLRHESDYANIGPILLMQLCGRKQLFHQHHEMTEHDVRTCQALLGEHGWAYYKMLEARSK